VTLTFANNLPNSIPNFGGIIPANWNRIRLKHLTKEALAYGANEAALEDNPSYPRFIRITDIKEDGSLRPETFKSLPPEVAQPYLLDDGDVLLARSGATVGKAFIYRKEWGTACFAGYLIRCRCNQKILIPDFFFYYTQSIDYWSQIYAGSIQATIQNFSGEKYGEISISIPPKSQQFYIVNYLDRETTQIDNLIAAKEQMLTLLEEKREALISHAVTRGLDPNVSFKRSGLDWLGDIPEHWEVGKLGYKFSVKARLGWKGLKAEEYVDKGYIFLATPNIKNKEIDFENVNYINAERYFESPEIMLEVGDILVVKDGSTLGIISLVQFLPSPATVNSSIAVLRAKDKLESNFFYYFFTANYTQNVIQRLKDGQGVPHLFQADLKKFNIMIPPLKEQKQICDYLDVETAKFDGLLAAIKQSITLLKERRSALITAAVTGQITLEENYDYNQP
jgi:type I restriction enzyme S subunit